MDIKRDKLIIVFFLLISISCSSNYIDPTGIYSLNFERIKTGIDTFDRFGRILVKKISRHKIAMTIFICMGAPGYNSGYFSDTLDYFGNKANFSVNYIDPSCSISFCFSSNGVTVEEKTDDFNWGWGFGHNVDATGLFEKTSSDRPEFLEFSNEEEF